MTLIELRYLVAVAETRHFGRAADRFKVSQSTLSMAVRKLEQSLGVPLFERSKSGMCATGLGAQIIVQAQRALAQADSIIALAEADKHQLSGALKLGAIFTLGPFLLPQLLPALKLSAPQLSMNCYEGYHRDLRHKLRSSELDAILISEPFTEADVVTQEIYREPLQLVMPPTHALAAKKIIALDDLQEQTVLVLGDKQCLRQQMLAVFEPKAKHTIECSSLDTLRNMIAMGLGISILPSSAVSSAIFSPQALVARPLHTNPMRNISLAWRASFPRHKAIDAIRRAIQVNAWQFTTAQDTGGSGLLVDNNSW
jgi:LysR family transcriptional regulator, hydrogen peroxide-inducible genes activator